MDILKYGSGVEVISPSTFTQDRETKAESGSLSIFLINYFRAALTSSSCELLLLLYCLIEKSPLRKPEDSYADNNRYH